LKLYRQKNIPQKIQLPNCPDEYYKIFICKIIHMVVLISSPYDYYIINNACRKDIMLNLDRYKLKRAAHIIVIMDYNNLGQGGQTVDRSRTISKSIIKKNVWKSILKGEILSDILFTSSIILKTNRNSDGKTTAAINGLKKGKRCRVENLLDPKGDDMMTDYRYNHYNLQTELMTKAKYRYYYKNENWNLKISKFIYGLSRLWLNLLLKCLLTTFRNLNDTNIQDTLYCAPVYSQILRYLDYVCMWVFLNYSYMKIQFYLTPLY
ncbi:hypothetical protein AGLY_009450, partial [Aphis glycines]